MSPLGTDPLDKKNGEKSYASTTGTLRELLQKTDLPIINLINFVIMFITLLGI